MVLTFPSRSRLDLSFLFRNPFKALGFRHIDVHRHVILQRRQVETFSEIQTKITWRFQLQLQIASTSRQELSGAKDGTSEFCSGTSSGTVRQDTGSTATDSHARCNTGCAFDTGFSTEFHRDVS